jgi:glycine oxidase
MSSSRRIAIAGAGLVGRLCAFHLSRAGHSCVVFDRSASAQPALGEPRAAAWTSAGMLSPIAEMESGGAEVRDLGRRSLALWKVLAPQVERNHQSLGLHLNDSLMVCHAQDTGAADRVLRLLQDEPGQVEPLAAQDIRPLAPGLKGTLHAWRLLGEGHLHPQSALKALYAASLGVDWRWGSVVDQITPGSLRINGSIQDFDWVIDARGTGAAPDLAVRGVRGEVIVLQAPGFELSRPVRLLHPRWRVYIVPWPGDRIVVGATEIESEDLSPISVQSTMELLSAAFSIFPGLAEARILSTDVNLRPAMPDNLPVIQTAPGLTRINGLFRHGWLLAPAVIEDALSDANLY